MSRMDHHPTLNTDEFNLYLQFKQVLIYWWLVALATFLGGAFGFLFFHLQAPIYEASASYIVTIDASRFPFQGLKADMVQYNEDIAVNTTQDALLSKPVLESVITQAGSSGLTLTSAKLLQNSTIERKQEDWELRYRSQDPLEAQKVVNLWADTGYQAMLAWQQSGKAPAYVVFQPPSQADLPTEPVLYNRNRILLAAALIGFIVGVILTGAIKPGDRKRVQIPQ